MKQNRKYAYACASLFIGATLMAWQNGPQDNELISVSNPSGYLGNNVITSGDFVGDIGLFLSGSIGNPVNAGFNSTDSTSNVWVKLLEANSPSGRLVLGSTKATIGNVNAQIGGESGKTVTLARLIGGSDAGNAGNITLDVGGNGSIVNLERIYVAGLTNSNGDSSAKNVTLNLNSGVSVSTLIAGGQNWASVSGKSFTVDKVNYNFNGVNIRSGSLNEGVYGGIHVNTQSGFVGESYGTVNNGVEINIGDNSSISSILVAGGYATNKNAVSIVNGGTLINIDGNNAELGRVFGGGQGSFNSSGVQSGAKAIVNGGSVVNMKNGSAYEIYGGGFAQGSSLVTTDKTTVNVSGGTVFTVVGGAYGAYNGVSKVGTENSTATVSTVNISGTASVTGNVVGGSETYAHTGVVGTVVDGNTEVNVSGGSVGGNVIGSSITSYRGDGESVKGKTGVAIHNGNSTVNISGGNVGGSVYGGGYAIFDADNFSKITTSGNSEVNISGGTILGDVYAGGYGIGTVVKGNSTVTLSGATAVVGGTIYGGGENGAIVEGSKNLNLDGFTGSIKAQDFDNMNVSNSSVATVDGGYGFAAKTIVSNAKLDLINANISNKTITSQDFGPRVAVVRAETGSTLTVKNSNFENNKSESLEANNGTYGTGISAVSANLNVENTTFKNNESVSNTRNTQGGAIYAGDSEVSVSNSVFDGNKSTALKNAGGAAMSVWGSKTTITNTEFKNNQSVAGNLAQGAIYAEGADWGGTNPSSITIKDSSFVNNSAIGSVYASGGAISAISTNNAASGQIQTNRLIANITDTAFTNNTVSAPTADFAMGGAIYSQSAEVNITATKDMTYSGNKVLVNGVANDNNGGFLYMDSYYGTATTNFNVAAEKTLTIGDGTKGQDSIASDYGTSVINKTGAGTLTVNGSMQNYQGQLNVNEGTMNVNNGFGGKVIVSNANLGLNNANISNKTLEQALVNGSIRGGLVAIDKASELNMANSRLDNNTISTNASYNTINGGLIDLKGNATLTNVTANGNVVKTYGDTASSIMGGLIAVRNNKTVVSGSSFANNLVQGVNTKSSPQLYGSVMYVGAGDDPNNKLPTPSAEIKDSSFTSNKLISTYATNGGAVFVNEDGALSIDNSTFSSNSATSDQYKARGGALANYNGTLSVNNVTFDSNSAESTSKVDGAQGGALYSRAYNAASNTTLTDVSFTNNTVKNGMGGAIFNEGSPISINATKNISVLGNSAAGADGVASDSRGGFLYMVNYGGTKPASANFNVAENAVFTIGDGRVGCDSIASSDNTAVINKAGVGTMLVNSSMEYFTGSLNINEGNFVLANKLGAATVSGNITALISASNSSKINDTTTIFNGTSFASGATVNVGFDVTHDVSKILGATTNVYSDASGKPAVNFLGENGVYTFVDKANQSQNLSYTVTDGNKVVIANSLGIFNASTGAAATITKENDATTLQVTSGTVEVAHGTAQTVNEIKTDAGTALSISGGDLKADSVSENSKVVVSDGGAEIKTIADTATVEVSGGTLKTESLNLTLGGTGTSSTVQVTAGTIESANAMNLVSNIAVAENSSLEIKSELAVSNTVSMATTGQNSVIKLQKDVTLSGDNTKLVLDGNVKGAANFSGVVGSIQTVEFTSTFGPGNSPTISTFKEIATDFTKSTSVLSMEVFSNVNMTAGTTFDQVSLQNSSVDFGGNGKVEILIDKLDGVAFQAGVFEYKLFDADATSSVNGLTVDNMTIVMADAVAKDYKVMFTNDGGETTSSVISQSALDAFLQNGTVSLTFEVVPEPAQIAALLGALALALAIYRRRRA